MDNRVKKVIDSFKLTNLKCRGERRHSGKRVGIWFKVPGEIPAMKLT